MKHEFNPRSLDLRAFARAAGRLAARESLAVFPRLAAEAARAPGDAASEPAIEWAARGETRTPAGASEQPWLHLTARVVMPLTCQRCLEAVMTELSADRWFRFVDSEAVAAAEDEEADEDVLEVQRDFDLQALIEDELIMALPLVARHDACPTAVPLVDAEGVDDSEPPHPFAVLAALRQNKSN